MLRTKPSAHMLPAFCAAALGALFFLLVYGVHTLNPQYDAWIFAGQGGDSLMQSYTGWAAFRAGNWALPLTYTDNLGWPLGAAASLTDCIPLLAVPFKLVSFLLPETFQYFGWFILCSVMLTGWGAARLLGLMGLRGWACVLGSCFFSVSPVLLGNAFSEPSLCAQWLVVFALYHYFHARQHSFGRPVWAFTVLAALAASINAYFVPMVLAIALGAALQALYETRRPAPLQWLFAAIAAALACGFAIGLFSSFGGAAGSYGHAGLDLTAFWAQPGSPAWLCAGVILGLVATVGLALWWWLSRTASLGGAAAQWPPQTERMVELGAALPPARRPSAAKWQSTLRRAKRLLRRHWGLLAACLLLCFFAVTNAVSIGGKVRFTLPLPTPVLRLLDVFGNSRLLIWPVYYLLVLLAVLGCGKLARILSGKGWAGPLLLASLFLLQIAGSWGPIATSNATLTTVAQRQVAASWRHIAQPGRVLYLLEPHNDRELALQAAVDGMPSNLFTLSRGGGEKLAEDMEINKEKLLTGKLPPGNAVYMTTNAELAARLTRILRDRCERVEYGPYVALVPLQQPDTL